MTATVSPPETQRASLSAVQRLRRSRAGDLADRYRSFLSSLAFFVTLIGIFVILSPSVFTSSATYAAIFTSVPSLIVLAVGLVFVVSAGEIDLSFASVASLSAMVFALIVQAGRPAALGLAAALLTGLCAGLLNAVLVTVLRLSSLVATLGVNFLLAGLVDILRSGQGIPLAQLQGTPFYETMVGRIGVIPMHLVWSLLFAGLALLIFARHTFGLRVRAVGDRATAAAAMGVSVRRVRATAFAFLGVASGLAGVFTTMVNLTFFSNVGESFLLMALAAVFVGGTPTWGGVGTIAGAVVGALTVGILNTGIVGVGLTGYYTAFFYGLIIILSLSVHALTRAGTRT